VVALFVDIAGSTALTRELEPTEFVTRLNRFFSIVVHEVEVAGGLVNKFEGDAALCVFGAPEELADPASAALRTARAIRDQVLTMGDFVIGVGVAAGPVIAGQIGAPTRLEYTVIGDAVNEASRLTDVGKKHPTGLAAAEVVVRSASADEQRHWHHDGELTLRGRVEPTRIWVA
jgi:adenylate cyclase